MRLTMVSVAKQNCTTYRELAEYGNVFNCLICVDAFSNAQVLDCNHAFCDSCLKSYCRLFGEEEEEEEQNGDGKTKMPCPICRKPTSTIRDRSASSSADVKKTDDGLPPIRKVSLANESNQRCEACIYRYRVEEAEFYCGKCSMNFCSACKIVHDQIQVFKGHTVIHVRNKDTFSLYCDAHPKVVCMYFCHDCDRPVCTVCILQGHRTHRTTKLREALSARRDVLKTLLNEFGPKLERLESKVRKLSQILVTENGNGNGLTGNQDRCRKNGFTNGSKIVQSFNRNSGLTNGGSELLKTEDKGSVTDDDEKYLKDLVGHVSRNRKLYDLSTKLIELSQSKKLLAVYQDVSSRLRTVLKVEFQRMQDDLEEEMTKKMELCVRSSCDHTCSELDSGSSAASSLFRMRHSSGLSNASAAVSDVEYTSQSMLIRPKLVWKHEKQRSDVGDMWNPCGAAFIRDDRLIVAEYDMINDRNNKLRIFNCNGQSQAVIAQGQIQPLGVVLTRDDHVAVTDCKGKRVKVLTLNGQTIIDIGKGQFGWPYGIAANSKGQLIITDAFNDSVSIYSVDGKRIRQFGSSGSQNSQFRNPYHVTVDARDNVIISDSGNNCIKAFDQSGRFIFSAAETGVRRPDFLSDVPEKKMKRRRLKGPRGISVDFKGNILVADDCSRVCMFDSAGKYVRNLLTEEDSVKYPEVVHCGQKGLLAVTEWNPANMYAVKVFKLYE